MCAGRKELPDSSVRAKIGFPRLTIARQQHVSCRRQSRRCGTRFHDWEKYLHDDQPKLPLLIRCALMDYQFETIHPFLDGNGRLGRLFIILYLLDEG